MPVISDTYDPSQLLLLGGLGLLGLLGLVDREGRVRVLQGLRLDALEILVGLAEVAQGRRAARRCGSSVVIYCTAPLHGGEKGAKYCNFGGFEPVGSCDSCA